LHPVVLSVLAGGRTGSEGVVEACCREFFEETREVTDQEPFKAAVSESFAEGAAFGWWEPLGKFLALFVPERAVIASLRSGGEDIVADFHGADTLVLKRHSLEAAAVHWVAVPALLSAVPESARPVNYRSPGKEGAAFVLTHDGERVRVGHFLTMMLMQPKLRKCLQLLE